MSKQEEQDCQHCSSGDEEGHAQMAADFRRRFWIVLTLTVPILALSPMIQGLVGLTQADVGIAIGAGTDVAIESADVVLTRSNPRGVTAAIEPARATRRKMLENLLWATGYNVSAMPLAGVGLAFAGILLSPAVGAAVMPLSSVIVAFNARRLKGQDAFGKGGAA